MAWTWRSYVSWSEASSYQSLTGYTHRQLGDACVSLGLPEPPGERARSANVSVRVSPRCQTLTCRWWRSGYLRRRLRMPPTRNAIQDVLWAEGSLEIPKRTRREIARDLDLADLVHNVDRFTALLGRLWVLDDDMFGWLSESTTSLRARIERHVFRNPGDWTTEELFEQLGAFEATDAGSHDSWRGWSLPIPSLMNQPSGTSLTPSTRICVAWEPSCVKSESTVVIQYSALSRLARHITGGQRMSYSPRWPSLTSDSPMPSTTISRSLKTRTRSWSTTGPSEPTASDGATCRPGGRTRSSSPRGRSQEVAVPEAHPQPARKLTSAAESVRALPRDPQRRGAGPPGAPARGMAALGPKDSPRARP